MNKILIAILEQIRDKEDDFNLKAHRILQHIALLQYAAGNLNYGKKYAGNMLVCGALKTYFNNIGYECSHFSEC